HAEEAPAAADAEGKPTPQGEAEAPAAPKAPVHAVPTPNLPGMVGPNVPAQEGVDPRTLKPTATQAVVTSRPLIPVRRVTPPSQYRPGPGAGPGRRQVGELREVRVVPDSQGRGRDFIDVTRDRGGRPRRGGPRPAPQTPAGPPSRQDLMAMATGRMGAFPIRP